MHLRFVSDAILTYFPKVRQTTLHSKCRKEFKTRCANRCAFVSSTFHYQQLKYALPPPHFRICYQEHFDAFPSNHVRTYPLVSASSVSLTLNRCRYIHHTSVHVQARQLVVTRPLPKNRSSSSSAERAPSGGGGGGSGGVQAALASRPGQPPTGRERPRGLSCRTQPSRHARQRSVALRRS